MTGLRGLSQAGPCNPHVRTGRQPLAAVGVRAGRRAAGVLGWADAESTRSLGYMAAEVGSGARRGLPEDAAEPTIIQQAQPAADEQAAHAGKAARKPSTFVVGLLAGVLIGATAITAQGDDLRPDRTNDIAELASQAEQRNAALAAEASALRQRNEELAAAQGAHAPSADPSEIQLGLEAGLGAVRGPAVQVTLTDAPADFAPPGVDGDLLVVHEQDIQKVVNAMWAAGAEAMTIQGQRVVATTAVKCVGNTVVLHGAPYAPPYVVTAIGDQAQIEAGLASDPGVTIYRQYAQAYQLGYAQQRVDSVEMPAFTGALPQQATIPR